MTSDANILVNNARLAAQRHLYTYNEDMCIEQLVQNICDLKQGYTQYGGLRPFGASFLFAGHDEHFGYQLYQSDPAGNYSGWKATCIGANSTNAQSILKSDYKEEMTLKEAKSLAIKVLSKTMESTSMSSEKVEMATLSMSPAGKLVFHIFTQEEIDQLLKDEGVFKKEEEAK